MRLQSVVKNFKKNLIYGVAKSTEFKSLISASRGSPNLRFIYQLSCSIYLPAELFDLSTSEAVRFPPSEGKDKQVQIISIYLRFIFDLSSIYLRFIFDLSSIYLRFIFDLSSIYLRFIFDLSSIYLRFIFDLSTSEKVFPLVDLSLI